MVSMSNYMEGRVKINKYQVEYLKWSMAKFNSDWKNKIVLTFKELIFLSNVAI